MENDESRNGKIRLYKLCEKDELSEEKLDAILKQPNELSKQSEEGDKLCADKVDVMN